MRELDAGATERNYAKEPLTKAELEKIVEAAGGDVARVLNLRHAVSKASGWKDKPPTKTAFIKAALEDNNLVRRPIVIRNGDLVVGQDLEAIRELLGRAD